MKKVLKSLSAIALSIACMGYMSGASLKVPQKTFAESNTTLADWMVTSNAHMQKVEKVISGGANKGEYSVDGGSLCKVLLDDRAGLKFVSLKTGKDAEGSSFRFKGAENGFFSGGFETDLRIFSEHSMAGSANKKYKYRTSPEDIVRNVNGYSDVALAKMTFTDQDTGKSFSLNLAGGEELDNSSVYAYVTSDSIPFGYRVANSYDENGNSLGISFMRGDASPAPEVIGKDAADLYVPKSVYKIGEPIIVSAKGSGKDWIGIKQTNQDFSRDFQYIDFSEGGNGSNQPTLLNWKDQVDSDGYSNLIPGEYDVILVRNDGKATEASASARITILPHDTANYSTGEDSDCLNVYGDVFEANDCIPISAKISKDNYDWVGIRRGSNPTNHDYAWVSDHLGEEYFDINVDDQWNTQIHEPADDYSVIFVRSLGNKDAPANSYTADAKIRIVRKFMNDLKPTCLLQTSFSNTAKTGEEVSNAEVLSNRIGFDPATMEVYGYARTSVSDPTLKKVVILDLDNMDMSGFENEFKDTFKGNYSVDFSVDAMADNGQIVEVNGEKVSYERHASMMVYSVNGHEATKDDIMGGENIKEEPKIPEEVVAVMDKIDVLGKSEYTVEFKAKLDDIKSLYNGLTAENKALVSNIGLYEKAEKEYKELENAHKNKVAEEEASIVDEKITAIGEVTLESKALIEEARNSYNALSDLAKSKVKNLAVLEDAEKELLRLEEANKPVEKPENGGCSSMMGGLPLMGILTVISACFAIKKKDRS